MSLARDVTTVGSATLLSRAARLCARHRHRGRARRRHPLPTPFSRVADPNLFRRLLAEGALNAAFVPIWLRMRDERRRGRRRAPSPDG